MVTTLVAGCECGRINSVVISKEAQYRALGMDPEEGKAIDAQEAAAGELEGAVAMMGAIGVERFTFPDKCRCGRPLPSEADLLDRIVRDN